MKSSHVDLYNHDEDAATYDQDVLRSEDPIREGYIEVLDWVAHNSGITQDSTVVERKAPMYVGRRTYAQS
ncbi:MAG: hypothetical protein OXH63_01185, partial [Gemmatimonadetes bacterium]|nr:hypothetical protein [Gemmatimonadota bacterium]